MGFGSRRDSVQDTGDYGRQAGGRRGRRDARRLLPRGPRGRLAGPRGADHGARGAVRDGDTRRGGREDHHGRRGRGLRRPAPGGATEAPANGRGRALITGAGAVTPLGTGVENFWDAALRGEGGNGPITPIDDPPRPPPR